MNSDTTHPSAEGTCRQDVIRRLIAGRDTEDIVVYDVSDCQLYGRRHREVLEGESERLAIAAGFQPVIYQCVYWLTLVYIPVWPLGTFLILQREICDDPDGDALQYRAIRVPTDVMQVLTHYAIAMTLIVAGIACLGACWF